MRYIKIILIILVLAGCASVPQEGEFTASGHYRQNGDGSYDLSRVKITLVPVGTVLPTSTIVTSPTPTVTSVPSATPTVVPPTATPIVGVNLFKDPGLEGPYINKLHSDGYSHIVPVEWTAEYCDGCPAYRQGTGNPVGLVLGRPEYKPAGVDQDSLRIHSGTNAVEYFGFYRAIEGGIYQTVTTPAGSTCEVTGYVQAWSGVDGDRDPHVSHLITQDDKDNAKFYIAVDLSGGTNAFAGGVLKSRMFGYSDGIYDRWTKINYTFTATGNKTTVFFNNVRLWPVRNNNNYLDDLSIVCSGGSQPTPAPITPTSTTVPDSLPANVEYTVVKPVINVRSSREYNTNQNITRTMKMGDKVVVHCVIESPAETFWGSPSSCQAASEWFVIRLNGDDYAKPPEGAEGY